MLLDGFVTTAAALLAHAVDPTTIQVMIAGHRSAERGHGIALDRLGLEPLLEFDMRLGEATGALAALPLLDLAASIPAMAALSDLPLDSVAA